MLINIFFINDKWEVFIKYNGMYLLNIIVSRNRYKILNRTKTDTGK